MKAMGQRPLVLLAESDAHIRAGLSGTLERAGCRVLGPAESGAEARRLLGQEKPCVAIIDVVLRDGSSTGLAHALRHRNVPFLMHSKWRPDQLPVQGFEGVPWLTKPALSEEVLACVNDLAKSSPTLQAGQCKPKLFSRNPLIRKLDGFTTLSDTDRAKLARISAETHHVPSGTDLVCEGEAPVGVFLIMDGIACRHKLRANGARQIIAYMVPGDLCDPDVALLSEMDHTITTLSACKVVRLAPETMADLLVHNQQIAKGLRKSQLVDKATLREWLVNVGRRSAPERIAHLFCELLARLQVVDRASEDAYALPITQIDLADTTGLTAVHVSRTLRSLRQKGLIDVKKRHVQILDLPRLKAVAEFKPNYLHRGEKSAA